MEYTCIFNACAHVFYVENVGVRIFEKNNAPDEVRAPSLALLS